MSAFVWCLCVDRDKQAFTCDVIDEDGWPHTFYLLEEAVGAGEELVVDYGAEYAPLPLWFIYRSLQCITDSQSVV